MKRNMLLFLLSWTVWLHGAEEPPREALLVGVGDYGGATYKGKRIRDLPGITSADLPQMKQKLESLGFRVRVVVNPTRSESENEVAAFYARLREKPGVSLFYFSGHGGEYLGRNYLIPREARIGSATDLADQAVDAQRVLNGMEESGANVNLVFLDCCREDLGKSMGGSELAPLKARGSFVGFATRSGDFADPEAKGSPYTRFLLKHLDRPGISVADMYAGVIADVRDYSKRVLGEERRPGFYSELDAPFYFAPASLGRVAEGKMPLPVPVEPSKESKVVELAPENFEGVLGNGVVGRIVSIPLVGTVAVKMCYVPPGKFTMGSPISETGHCEDENQVPVEISRGFWLAQTEMTQEQWQAVMGTNPSGFKYPRNPVEEVSWKEAQACVTKLNQKVKLPGRWRFGLPTEAQWEYACRAGTTTAYAFGEMPGVAHANFDAKKPMTVAGYPPNAWGLHDMHGNVFEWCADWYEAQLRGGTDPKGPASGTSRVLRGGSWGFNALNARCAQRNYFIPGDSYSHNYGFRLALTPSK
jgi:hypothetical protein